MNAILDLPAPRPTPVMPAYVQADDRLRDAAQKLEATFLAEMLKSAGLGAARDSFGGGQGEEQFASFLRGAQASEMAKAGGIGLAEALFEAMKLRVDAT
ncbi:MAG: rod-binding protein [Yoonia sp.]|uniref:rod-binding protein n=1 Tax=Yoonia sp. TaxID=2212373 RepID=UPI003EF150D0